MLWDQDSLTEWSAWASLLGFIVGVPGFLLLVFQGQVVVGLLVAILVAVLLWTRWTSNQPEFTLLEVERIITLQDVEGKLATMIRRQVAQANHKGQSQFSIKTIAADGPIQNIRIDGREPDYQAVECGTIEVCKFFRPPLTRGQQDALTLSYDLVDAFLKDSESMIHIIGHKTKKLRMVVRSPSQRPIRAARASLRYGGQIHKSLPQPKMTNQACQIEIEIRRPKLGAQYYLEWDW